MMVTNTGFTEGAKAVAKDEGVALHIVRPSFDRAILDSDPKNREVLQTQLQKLSTNSKPPYVHEMVHRAFELETVAAGQSSVSIKTSASSQGIVGSSSNRMRQPPSNRQLSSSTSKAPRGQGRSQQRFTRNTGGRGNRGR